MTTHDQMRQWLASGDPARIAHARFRLTQPDAPLVTDATPCLRSLTCLYLTLDTCAVGKCAAGYGSGKYSLVRAEDCTACLKRSHP